MGDNISNKKYNFFILEIAIWQLFSALLFSKKIQLYWIHFLTVDRSILKWRRQGKWYFYIYKIQYFKPSFIPTQSPENTFLFRTGCSCPNILTFIPKIWSIFTYSICWNFLGEDEAIYKHRFYNALSLQWANRGDQQGKRKNILLWLFILLITFT